MKKTLLVLLFSFLIILLGLLLTPQTVSAQSPTEPGLEILSAKEDLHVLIFAHDFPPFLELQVTMRPLGAPDEKAVEVTTVNAEESGTFFQILYIPPPLVGEAEIEIRLEGIKSTFAAENTFSNETFEDDQAARLAREIIRMAEAEPEEEPEAVLPPAASEAVVEDASPEEAVVEEALPEEEISTEPEPPPVPTTEEEASSRIQAGGEEGGWEDPVPFVWPAEKRWLSGYNFSETHPGIDIAAKADDLIFAAASGKVVRVDRSEVWYGNMIMLQHGNGYQTLYAHLNEILVELGSYVLQGQPIGLAGSTGNSTGPHLHFEIRYRGEFINPWLFFNR